MFLKLCFAKYSDEKNTCFEELIFQYNGLKVL